MVVGESRAELLNWLNSTLDLNYTKIEQCGSGAAFCQLMDTIVGDVPLSKVKFNAKTEYEFRHNYKILQHVFVKNSITKTIDVEKLIRCKLQDNLELLQWIKRYASSNNVPMKTTVARQPPKQTTKPSTGSPESSPINDGPSAAPLISKPRERKSNTPLGSRKTSSNGPINLTPTAVRSTNVAASKNNNRSGNGTIINNGHVPVVSASEPVAATGTAAVAAAVATTDSGATSSIPEDFAIYSQHVESERDFYFNKLRAIEILVQHAKEMEGLSGDVLQFANEIEKIMYEEYVEDDEF